MGKVLIVDDIEITRHKIRSYMEKFGHTVICEASNGDDALELYKQFSPDIVTMDITMPPVNGVVNGLESLRLIRQYDNEAKVIMITSYGSSQLIIDAINLGARGYVLKPIEEEKLESALSSLKLDT